MIHLAGTESPTSNATDIPDEILRTPDADRETFITEVRENLNKIQTKLSSMKDEGSRLGGDLKRKADESLMKLDSKYRELKTKVEAFNQSTAETWKSDKEALQKSFKEYSANFKGLFS